MNSIRNTWIIAKRELHSYFASPVAYVFIVIFLVLSSYFTFKLGGFFLRNEASLFHFFRWHPWLYLVLVPALGMRIWAEEHRSRSIELLLTMPINVWQAIVGKFLAAWFFLGITLALTFPMVCTVYFLGDPDGGIIFSGYLGSFMLLGVYLAVTTLTSAMTRNQVVSFIISVVICFFLILAGYAEVTELFSNWAPVWMVSFVAGFGVMPHFESLQRGIIDTRGIAYFITMMGFCLFVTSVVLKNRRS